MFWNLFSPRLSIEEVAKIRKAYFEGNYDDFYFIFQKNLRIPDSYFTKRKFLSEKEKKEYDGRFASARYFRGIEEWKDILDILRKIKKNTKIFEIYLGGSIINKGPTHNDIDILVLLTIPKDQIYYTHFIGKRSLTFFEILFIDKNLEGVSGKSRKVCEDILKKGRKIDI